MDIQKYIEIKSAEVIEELEKDLTETKEKAKYENSKNNQFANAYLTGRAAGIQTALNLLRTNR